MRRITLFAVLLFTSALPVSAAGAGPEEFHLSIRDHRFEPAELSVPAGKRIVLIINNTDAQPEEFESPDLDREKVVPGHAAVSISIGPLRPGRYAYFGEFHPRSARGWLLAK